MEPANPQPYMFPATVSADLAARINSFAWEETPLGSIARWPQSLRTALSILLGSRFPMQLLWGPTYIHFYNDAYRPIAGDKHPAALGRTGAEIWPEVWHEVLPMLEQVRATGAATWSDDMLLVLDRGGGLSEGYFTFSYSAVAGDSGAVDGVFVAVTETTRRVIGERRLRLVRDLSAALGGVTDEDEVYQAARAALEGAPDLAFALIYGVDEETHTPRHMAGTAAAPPAAPAAPEGPDGEQAAEPWPFAQARAAEGVLVTADDGSPAARLLLDHRSSDRSHAPAALVLPLIQSGAERRIGYLVAGFSPLLPFDAEYREFLERVAGQIAGAAARARAYAAANHALRVRDDFLSIAAHELKTPLTPIIGRLQLLRRRLGREGIAEHHLAAIDDVVREANRLTAMVDALLDVSRLRSGQLDIRRAMLDLREPARRVFDEVYPTLTDHQLVIEQPESPVMIEGDEGRLVQVLRNLVSNAVKYSPLGGTIGIRVARQSSLAYLSVRDQGIGIADEDQHRLFDRYFRAEDAERQGISGLGVGLFVVHEIVRLHGGALSVESSLGAGSTFVVALPAPQAVPLA